MTDPLLRLQSPLKCGLEFEEQQLYYVKQHRDVERKEVVEEISSEWNRFSFGKFMVTLLFM